MAAITGMELLHGTDFGRALLQHLPKELTRIVIDIPVTDIVKIYYQGVDASALLDLKWGDEFGKIEIVSVDGPMLNRTHIWPEPSEGCGDDE